jgi:hypothetical protein
MQITTLLPFLKSTRFWSLVILAVLYYLNSKGLMAQDIFNALAIIIGGHAGIRTIDRFAEQV